MSTDGFVDRGLIDPSFLRLLPRPFGFSAPSGLRTFVEPEVKLLTLQLGEAIDLSQDTLDS